MIRTTIRGTHGSGKTDRALDQAAIHAMGRGERRILIVNDEENPESIMYRLHDRLRGFGVQTPDSGKIWVHSSGNLNAIGDAIREIRPTMVVFDLSPGPMHANWSHASYVVAQQRHNQQLVELVPDDIDVVETIHVQRRTAPIDWRPSK